MPEATAADRPPALSEGLIEALSRAQSLGFLGDGPLSAQIDHALGFAEAVGTVLGTDWAPPSFLDLGSGGGLPGLVLADRWPTAQAVLLDAGARRADELLRAVDALGWADRVRVVRDRAESAGRDLTLRASQDLVVARSFGPPAATAECGAPFLVLNGLLVVSEPPLVPDRRPVQPVVGHDDRWPADQITRLGLEAIAFAQVPFGYQVLHQVEVCPERYPRRDGVPAKRPLF